VSAPFVWRCINSPSVPRFHIPLVEPDVQISRIRLSDGRRRQAHAARTASPESPSLIWSRLVFFWRRLEACATLPTVVPFTSTSEVRPLSSVGVTRLRRYYELVRHPMRPGLSLAGCRLVPLHHRWGFLLGFIRRTGRRCGGPPCISMPSPLPRRDRWMHALLSFPTTAAFPGYQAGRLPH